ncbi:MAG: DUF937 domain-containing protein [Bryobacteraceae bacterium]
MNPILDMLMNAAGGGATQQIGDKFGLSPDQTNGALAQLVPALMAGMQKNTQQEGGMGALLGALTGGNHSQYLDNPNLLGQDATIDDGNSILGHVFGSKDVSRAVANNASAQTGIGADILKQMLPIVATMVMGAMSKQNSGQAAGMGASAGGAMSGGGLLGSLLDQNKDGSVADDVMGMLGKFLGR